MKVQENEIVKMNNNESFVLGVFPQQDGTFTALTFTASRNFKTRAGAEKWLVKRGFIADKE